MQRWLKFSKYLPEFGWDPIILTVDQAYAAYPVTDNSLTDDLPSTVKVYTTPATNYFNIQTIPANYILDKDRSIAYKNMMGPALDRAIGKLTR